MSLHARRYLLQAKFEATLLMAAQYCNSLARISSLALSIWCCCSNSRRLGSTCQVTYSTMSLSGLTLAFCREWQVVTHPSYVALFVARVYVHHDTSGPNPSFDLQQGPHTVCCMQPPCWVQSSGVQCGRHHACPNHQVIAMLANTAHQVRYARREVAPVKLFACLHQRCKWVCNPLQTLQ